MAIKNANPKAKSYRLYDEKGLYLEVTQTGSRLWRFKYRFDGKEKRLAIGSYPETSLKAARETRDMARTRLATGIDPSEHKKALKAARVTEGTKHVTKPSRSSGTQAEAMRGAPSTAGM